MPRRIMLSVFAIALGAITARAADLPVQSRLGAIFAEPADAGTPDIAVRERVAPIIPYNNLPNPVWNRGGAYYGSAWSYYYGGPYYGAPIVLGGRLPYVCGLYGYC
jgi:hypothetical protein